MADDARTPRRRRLGLQAPHRVGTAAVALGLALAAWAQVATPPAKPPLYDGLIVQQPYRYLAPGPGQPGHPGSAAATIAVQAGRNALVAVATTEQPPQAQLLAVPGAFVLPADSTRVRVSITPVAPPAQVPGDGRITGNVYRIVVTNQAGVALSAPASAGVSVVLRAPSAATTVAAIERLAPAGWQRLTTVFEAQALFLTVPTAFGDFAVVVPGGPGTGGSPSGPAAAPSALPVPSPSGARSALPVPSPSGAPGAGLPVTLIVAVVAGLVLLVALLGLSREGVRR